MSDERTDQPGAADPAAHADQPTQPDEPPTPDQPPAWPAPPEPPPAAWPPVGSTGPAGAPPGYGTPGGYGAPPGYAPPPGYGTAPTPGAVHPLDIGRAFSLGWSIFRFRWRTLLAATLALTVPALVVQIAITVYSNETLQRWAEAWQAQVLANPLRPRFDLDDLPPLPLDVLALSFVSGIAVALASVLAAGAVIHIVGWTYGGGRVSLGQALRHTGRRALSLIGSGVLMALAVYGVVAAGVGLIVLLIAATGFAPGLAGLLVVILGVATFAAVLFLTIRWQFVVQSIMLEGQGALGAMGRSWRLVSGSGWRVLGYLLLLILVTLMVGVIAGIVGVAIFGLGVNPLTGVPEPFNPVRAIGQTAIAAILALLITPFIVAVMTLLYYDLRWRAGEKLGPPPA